MRLDMQRERELQKRKGFAGRTIMAVIWLALCFTAGYFLINWLFDSEVITMNSIYNRLYIPRSVGETFIIIGMMIVFVIIVTFFVLVGYAFVSPTGRRRSGTPSTYTGDPDIDEQRFRYR